MPRIVFLIEERSMSELLRVILPKIFPDWIENQNWIALPHNGKSDLEASIPRKLRAWNVPEDSFVVLRDNDGGDCRVLKEKLLGLATAKPEKVLIRIVCQELESWLLGDPEAVKAAYPGAGRTLKINNRVYVDPDRLTNASDEILNLTKAQGKVGRAKAIGAHMIPEANRSHSFNVFVSGLRRLATPQASP